MMTTTQIKGMLRFHKASYKAYKASGQQAQSQQARAKMIELYLASRASRLMA